MVNKKLKNYNALRFDKLNKDPVNTRAKAQFLAKLIPLNLNQDLKKNEWIISALKLR